MRYCLLILLLGCVKALLAQSVTVVPVTVLPNAIAETSGLERTAPNRFWSHNDSGNQPNIFAFDTSGTLIKTITLTNATNVDWEDLAQGDNGDFYIGDFGNNNNDRSAANGTPLTIYVIPPPDGITGNTTTAQSIVFEYQDRDFNAPSNNHNFDMEAFFFFNDSLHLFSKNRTNPTTGFTKHYILPAVPGNYTAMLVDSFNNGGNMITSADIAPHKNTVALLAYNAIYLYDCFSGSKFLSTGHFTSINIALTQKEAILFSTDDKVYITDEYFNSTIGQKLYRANLSGFISPQLQIGSVVVDSVCPGYQNGQITIVPDVGYLPLTYTWSNGDGGPTADSLSTDTFTVHVTDSHGCVVDSAIAIGEYNVVQPVVTLVGGVLISNNPNTSGWLLNNEPFFLSVPNDTLNPGPNWGYYRAVVDYGSNCNVVSDSVAYLHIGLDNTASSPENIIISKTNNGYILNNISNKNYTVKVYAVDGRLLHSIPINEGGLQELTMPVEALHIFVYSTNNSKQYSIIR